MLTPKYLEGVYDNANLSRIVEQWELDTLASMAKRLRTYDYDIPAAQYQRMKLEAAGITRQELIKSLAELTGKAPDEIAAMMQEAGQQVLEGTERANAEVYRATELDTAALNQTINAAAAQTAGSFKNICGTGAMRGGVELFSQMMDSAYFSVSSGTMSVDEAVRVACSRYGSSGVHVLYESGHRMTLDSAARMVIRTGVNQAASKLQIELCDELDCDLVEVTAHAGARPSHAEWQGKVYSLKGKTPGYELLSAATGYGRVDGLCGANCRHSFFPTWDGDSSYTRQELASYEAPDAVSYNGKSMSEYEATQKQRALERQLRKWEREKAMDSNPSAPAKVKMIKAKLAEFTEQTGLKRAYSRERI